MKKIY
ncbi:putative membrane protein, partial [Yersinia pestis PY-14]